MALKKQSAAEREARLKAGEERLRVEQELLHEDCTRIVSSLLKARDVLREAQHQVYKLHAAALANPEQPESVRHMAESQMVKAVSTVCCAQAKVTWLEIKLAGMQACLQPPF